MKNDGQTSLASSPFYQQAKYGVVETLDIAELAAVTEEFVDKVRSSLGEK